MSFRRGLTTLDHLCTTEVSKNEKLEVSDWIAPETSDSEQEASETEDSVSDDSNE